MNDLEKVIPQLLAQGLLALRENCVMPRLVNSDYSTMGRNKGASIDIPIPSAIAAQDVTPNNVPPSTGAMKPTEVSIKLDQWKESPFYLTDKDLGQVMEGFIPMQASEAIKSLGNAVDAFIISKYKLIPGTAGVAGTTPLATNTVDATDARKVLNKQLAPLTDRRCVLDPDAEANALNLRAFQDVSWAGDAAVIQNGILQNKLGFSWHMDQNILNHVAGTCTDGTLNTAAAVADTSFDVASTAGGTFLEGDVITLAGTDKPYAVAADVTIGAGSTGTVLITEAVTEIIAGSAAVTLIASHVVNLAFHRDCFAFVSRPLLDSGQGLGNLIQSAVDPVSGLALRLEISREHKRTRYSYDILYGSNMVRSDLGCRLLG